MEVRVRYLKCMAGPNATKNKGDEATLPIAKAQRLVSHGCAEYVDAPPEQPLSNKKLTAPNTRSGKRSLLQKVADYLKGE